MVTDKERIYYHLWTQKSWKDLPVDNGIEMQRGTESEEGTDYGNEDCPL